MKNFLITFYLLFLPFTIFSQVVSVPQYAIENDSIKIIFDATQGGQGMMNYTGVLYTHTGVITNLSGGNWANVIGTWGNNSVQPSLTRISTDLYELVVGFPRQFYNVTNPNEHILKLAFVFRSADAQRQTEDIFLELYLSGLSVIFENPKLSVQFGDPLRSPAFANQDDTVDIDINAVEIGTEVSSLTLFINEVQAAQTNSNQLNYNFISADHNPGANNITAVGIDTAGAVDTASFIIFINPPPDIASPPANIIPGINYIDENSITLSLFAPYKEFVYVIGGFNDWKVNTDYFMNKHVINQDSVIWWLTIDSLNTGEEYIFQYFVDGEIRIADPYSEKVSDPWNDEFIPSATYPGLISYPGGKTAEIASVLQTAQQPYQWQVTDFQRPEKTDLIIYELLIRDFLAAHDYKTLEDTLNYLKQLGVNAIELMPVNEFEGNESWGYNVSLHFAADKYYGPKNDLKKFIDKCHELGIAVIFDMVLNHMYGQSPLVRLYWNAPQNRPAANNPWFNEVSPNQVFSFGFDFNHEKQVTKNYVDRVNRYWLEEFNFDGYRFDFTKGFTNTPGDGGAFDQSRINILKRMADKIREYDSTAYIILEHFAPNNEEKILSDYGMLLWGNMNHQYNEATMGYASDLNWGSYKTRGWNDPHLVTYMESHDEERLMYKNLQFGASNGGYNIKNLPTALNRIKLAAAFFFTIPGPKMILQFGELGYDISINDPCRVCSKLIKWDYYNDINRKNLYKVFAALIDLTEYEAFSSNDFTLNVAAPAKRININHPTMNVAIIGNFNVQAFDFSPNFQNTGIWYDYFTGDSLNVTNTQMTIPLQPGEFKIYTTVKLPTPEPGILTGVELEDNSLVEEFYLEQNFPNPFNPSTEIIFHVKELSNVTLKIFDILGREVKTLINEEKTAGIYNVFWNGDNNYSQQVSSGVYFYKIEAGNFVQTRKMLLLK